MGDVLTGGRQNTNGAYTKAMETFLPLVYGINRMKLKMKAYNNILSDAVPVAVEATTILFLKNVWDQAWARAGVNPKPKRWNAAKDKEHGICGRWGSTGTGRSQRGQDSGWNLLARVLQLRLITVIAAARKNGNFDDEFAAKYSGESTPAEAIAVEGDLTSATMQKE